MVVDGGAAVASRPSSSRRRASATAKPRAVVASRYLLPSSRPASPAAATRPAATRRPATMAADAAARAVSVAFQDASYCLDGGKARHVPHAPSPEKKRASFAAGAAAVRAKVCDARWPASAAAANSAPYGFRGGVATRSVAFDEMTPRRASMDVPNPLRAALSSDDTESATSSAGSPDGDADADAKLAARARPSPRSIMASPARFSRDAMGSRSERFADHSTPFMSRTPRFLASPSPKTKPTAPPPPTTTKKKSVKSLFNGLLSSPFTRPSPKQPPPTKPAAISPASPSPARCSATAAASAVPGRLQAQGKAEEEHQLRLLHNRHLQWRLANAVAGAAISAQELNAEVSVISPLFLDKIYHLKNHEVKDQIVGKFRYMYDGN